VKGCLPPEIPVEHNEGIAAQRQEDFSSRGQWPLLPLKAAQNSQMGQNRTSMLSMINVLSRPQAEPLKSLQMGFFYLIPISSV
jgi:hypothetical protein